MVKFVKKVKGFNINVKDLRRVAERVLEYYEKDKEIVTVVLCGNRYIKRLNKIYLSKNESTDVISFPINENTEEGRYLGDIAISVPYALESSKRGGWTLGDEIRKLLIHGILHLLGYDHEKDSGEMKREEGRLEKLLREENAK